MLFLSKSFRQYFGTQSLYSVWQSLFTHLLHALFGPPFFYLLFKNHFWRTLLTHVFVHIVLITFLYPYFWMPFYTLFFRQHFWVHIFSTIFERHLRFHTVMQIFRLPIFDALFWLHFFTPPPLRYHFRGPFHGPFLDALFERHFWFKFWLLGEYFLQSTQTMAPKHWTHHANIVPSKSEGIYN